MKPKCNNCDKSLVLKDDSHYVCKSCHTIFNVTEFCEFCELRTHTRQHHLIPKSKGGTKVANACETCESYIHKTWDHNQLRDTFNSIDVIKSNEGFQKFLKWRKKQSASTLFHSNAGKYRNKRKYT